MKTVLIEASSPQGNWGKFLIGVFDQTELAVKSAVDGRPLVWGRGWGPGHVLVVDLQTGEGGTFKMGGLASADLEKHNIWVCPLFEPFLAWLYVQPDPMSLPFTVTLEAPLQFAGYRRTGREDTMRELLADYRRRTSAHGVDSTDLDERAESLGLTTKES